MMVTYETVKDDKGVISEYFHTHTDMIEFTSDTCLFNNCFISMLFYVYALSFKISCFSPKALLDWFQDLVLKTVSVIKLWFKICI